MNKCYVEPKKERNIVCTLKRRRTSWIGHNSCRNCLIKHVIEGKIDGKRTRVWRSKQLLDDPKEKIYRNLKKEALARTVWRNRFGGSCGLTARQTTQWIMLETYVNVKVKHFIAQFIISPIRCFIRVHPVFRWSPTSLSPHHDSPYGAPVTPTCTFVCYVLACHVSFLVSAPLTSFDMCSNSADPTQRHSTPHCSAYSTFDLSKIRYMWQNFT